jgi:catechol 2,3-dioxygenase-like lactoylglutathione lyase family enzyme
MPANPPRGGLRWEYTGLRVRDLSRSVRFYRRLGFRVIGRGRMEHGGRWVGLQLPGSSHELELNHYPRGTRFHTPFRAGSEFDHLGFVVEDAEWWVRRLRRAHWPVVADWSEHGWRLIFVRDPDRNWLELGARLPPERPAARRRRVPRGAGHQSNAFYSPPSSSN